MNKFKCFFNLGHRFFNLSDRIFNRLNLTKVFIIFIVGFISRILVNQFFGVNVFIDYTNMISLIYYLVMSSFVVFVHELVGYFEFSIIPASLFNNIPNINLKALKLSSIRNAVYSWWSMKDNNVNKVTLVLENKMNNKESCCDNMKTSNVLYKNNHSGKESSIRDHGSRGQDSRYRSNNPVGNSGGSAQTERANNLRSHSLRHYNRSNNIRDLCKDHDGNYQSPVSRSNNVRGNNVRGNNVTRGNNSINLDQPRVNNHVPVMSQPQGIDTITTNQSVNSWDSMRGHGNSQLYETQCQPINNAESYRNNIDGNDRVSLTHLSANSLYFNINTTGNDVLLIPVAPSSNLSPHQYSSLVPIQPSTPNPNFSRISTPSTMSPLFPSNRATVGTTNPYADVVDWDLRRRRIGERVEAALREDMIGYSSKEVVIPKNGMLDKIKLGFKSINSKVESLDSKVDSIYIKYHDKTKRKFVWTIWERGQGNYTSYSEFKRSWDPNIKIWDEIKKKVGINLKSDVEGLIRMNDPFGKGKRVDFSNKGNIRRLDVNTSRSGGRSYRR